MMILTTTKWNGEHPQFDAVESRTRSKCHRWYRVDDASWSDSWSSLYGRRSLVPCRSGDGGGGSVPSNAMVDDRCSNGAFRIVVVVVVAVVEENHRTAVDIDIGIRTRRVINPRRLDAIRVS